MNYGGRLSLTATALVWTPRRFDSSFGGKPWSASLDEIKEAEVAERKFNLLGGGLRHRLRIRLNDGTEELFVIGFVAGVAEVVEVINQALEDQKHPS